MDAPPASIARAAPRPLIEWLWLLVAATFPFFAVEFFRLNDTQVLRVSFAAPMVVMALILAVGVAIALVEGRGRSGPLISHPLGAPLFGVMFLFLIWHVVSLIRAEDFKWGLREVTKLAMGLAAFWIVLEFFPRDRRMLHRFWALGLWTSALLMAFLIYQYAFVFVRPFLGNSIDEASRAGRNLLTWYLVFILPCAVTRFLESSRKPIDLVPLLVLTIAWVYAGSRGAWVSVVGGILVLLSLLISADPRRGLKVSLAVTCGLALAVVASWWILASSVDLEELEYGKRLAALFDPDAAPELQSSGERIELMQIALDSFMNAPLLGAGLMNSSSQSELVTHNDYLAILADMGLPGFAMFAGILGIVLVLLFRGTKGLDWVVLGTRASLAGVIVSLCFINAYTNMIFWIFLGLAVVVSETESQAAAAGRRPAAEPALEAKDLAPCAE